MVDTISIYIHADAPYAGTWIPLNDGRVLAERNGVLPKLQPIFDFVPGDRSPPPAPKHATAASTKPRVPRQAAQQRRPARKSQAQQPAQGYTAAATHSSAAQYAPLHNPYQDHMQEDTSQLDDGTPEDNATIASESAFDDYDPAYSHPHSHTRKKRRLVEDQMSQADKEHRLWADELLDYFMLSSTPDTLPQTAPAPPANANLDHPIDDKGHTALHWAAAMGDIEVVKDLIRRGANIDVQAKTGETPLMRAVCFTNCFDKLNMERVASLLIRTINMQEWTGSTVVHLIAQSTARKSKYQCARYYADCVLNAAASVLSPMEIERVLNEQDHGGDTAITVAARTGARKCVRSFIGRNAAVDIPNHVGETADGLIVMLNKRRQERDRRQLSSSPFGGDSMQAGPVQPPPRLNGGGGAPFDYLGSTTTGTFGDSMDGVYKSDAALSLTTSTMPTLFSKAKELATAFESELAEKEAELAEAERVAMMRKQELDDIRRKHDHLKVTELEMSAGGTETDAMLGEQLSVLERECEGLTEEEQMVALRELIGEQDGDGDTKDPNAVMREQLELARQIVTLQQNRRRLVKFIVEGLAVAGVGERQAEYKRLITSALGVREEEVEGMLPDIVAELEEWRGLEGVGVGA